LAPGVHQPQQRERLDTGGRRPPAEHGGANHQVGPGPSASLRDADRYVIAEFDSTQTPPAQLDALDQRRRSDRDRARRYRERKARSRDSSRDDKGQARTGQAVTQDLEELSKEEQVHAHENVHDDPWSATP
jgi:hypothetical protein